jgi:hypothetical protein
MEANVTKVAKATRGRIRSLFRLGDLSIRVRLIACFVLIVLLMIAADAVAVWQFRQMTAQVQRVSEADQTSYAVIRVHLDVDIFRDSVAELASSHDTRQFAGEAASIRRTFLQHVDHAEQMLRATPDIEQDASISSALESLRVTLLSQLDTAVQLATASEWDAVRLRLANQIPAVIEFSSLLVERVDQQALQQRIKAIEDAQKARQRLFIIVPIAALLTLLAAAALGWYVTRTITTPLSELTACAEALARGDFQHKANLRGNNELAVLGKAFNYAAGQLQKLYEDLRRSEKELRDVINAVPAHVWSTSSDGAVNFINQRWLEFTGLPLEDALGWNWEAVVHPDDRAKFVADWSTAVKDGQSIEREVRMRRADGEYRWWFVRNVPFRDEAGDIVKWYGTAIDIEDRKRAEHERAERFRVIANDTPAYLWMSSPQGENSFINRALTSFLGTDEGALGMRWGDFVHPDDRERSVEWFLDCTRDRRPYRGEFRLCRFDSVYRCFVAEGVPRFGPEGEFLGYAGSLVDVTEERRAEQERERLRQLEADLAHMNRVSVMGELAASLAHEIKQPIAAAAINAKSCLLWLQREPPDLGEAREAVSSIVKSARRAADIIDRNQSLYMRDTPKREMVSLNELIREMIVLLHDKAHQHSIFISIELDAGLATVPADRVQLQQVLLNLMLNGIEAMKDSSGEMTVVSNNTEAGQIQVSVADSGIGLPADKPECVFDTFFTTKVQGTGMGLSISRRIIESHGGRIWATGNSGRGATFHFTLPTSPKPT